GGGAETGAEDESTTRQPAEPVPRTTLSGADVEVESFELRQLSRSDWPQQVPAECRYSPDETVSANNLAYRDDGSTVDPLASARNVLGMLQCYEQSEEDVYLQKATEMATALYEAGESYDSGLFFPHDYAVRPHEGAGVDWTVGAPWYSATTQGVALSAFARLYTYSLNESVWMYAEEVLRSFNTVVTRADGPRAENPWAACVDDGYLWLEKYAQLPPSHVLSGMSLAAWGLYEQWMALQSSLARELFRATATTVKAYAEEFRNAGGPSYYCLAHEVPAPQYHSAHIRQLRTFSDITGDEAFAATARQFEADAGSAG
ncbi:D-glucuronyl C5-epimerase family protein, partial [Halobium palmae]